MWELDRGHSGGWAWIAPWVTWVKPLPQDFRGSKKRCNSNKSWAWFQVEPEFYRVGGGDSLPSELSWKRHQYSLPAKGWVTMLPSKYFSLLDYLILHPFPAVVLVGTSPKSHLKNAYQMGNWSLPPNRSVSQVNNAFRQRFKRCFTFLLIYSGLLLSLKAWNGLFVESWTRNLPADKYNQMPLL